ncbi:MAG: hypothetical protein ABJZ55_11165 [Fuerstiella sp.]
MLRTKNIRKSKYVNSFLQGNLMLRMVMYWAIYNFALLAAMIGESMVRVIPDLLSGSKDDSFQQFISEFTDRQSPMLLAMTVLCPILIWDMLRYSHRIAGPLYRFRKALTDHIAGEPLQKIKLRDGDMLLDFQDTWNEFVQFKKMQDDHRKMSALDAESQIAARQIASGIRPCSAQHSESSQSDQRSGQPKAELTGV